MHYFDWVRQDDRWLLWVIFGIVSLAILVFVFILIYRIHFILYDRRKRKFTSTLISLLSKALNNPEKLSKHVNRIKKLLRTSWQYEILLDQLINMCYCFQGVYATRAREIFDEFDLMSRSTRKLDSSRWDEIIEGIMELSVVAEEDGYKLITPLLNHPNPHVRREAKVAIVEIGKTKALLEMHGKMGVMSKWTFISVLSILHRNAFKLSKSDLDYLKNSSNPSMKALAGHLGKYSVVYN